MMVSSSQAHPGTPKGNANLQQPKTVFVCKSRSSLNCRPGSKLELKICWMKSTWMECSLWAQHGTDTWNRFLTMDWHGRETRVGTMTALCCLGYCLSFLCALQHSYLPLWASFLHSLNGMKTLIPKGTLTCQLIVIMHWYKMSTSCVVCIALSQESQSGLWVLQLQGSFKRPFHIRTQRSLFLPVNVLWEKVLFSEVD